MGPVYVMDATIQAYSGEGEERVEALEQERKVITEWLKVKCKKWAFQLEKGKETGYIHWQCRFSLHVKERPIGVGAQFKRLGLKSHITPTSKLAMNNVSYVVKTDTRILGPWESEEEKGEEPDDLKELAKQGLRPYQQDIIDYCKGGYLPRKIRIYYDPNGCMGKTTVRRYMSYNKVAKFVPPFTDSKDIGQWCMSTFDKANCKTYVIDIPRSWPKEKLSILMSSIESIKDGMLADPRHKGREQMISPPRIVIFTNYDPKLLVVHMSPDRPDVWQIDPVEHDAVHLPNLSKPAEDKPLIFPPGRGPERKIVEIP